MQNGLPGLKSLRFIGLALMMALACVAQYASAHSVAQLQTTKYFHPDTVAMLVARAQTGIPGFQVGDTVKYIIQFTPVANSSNWGVQGYVTDYIPDGAEVVQASMATKDSGGNLVDISPSLPGLSYDGWGARGQATFKAPFNVGTTYTTGCAAYPGNNCNARMSELQADTGIFYSTDSRTAQFPAMPARILQGGNGYNINPDRVGQLLPLLGGAAATTHNLWDADQTNGFGTSNALPTTAPFSSQTMLINTNAGDVPFNAGSPVAGPQTGYQLDNTGSIGPWKRIYYPGSRIGDASRGPATATGAPAGAVGGSTTSMGWTLSPGTPLPSGVNAVRWALGMLKVGEIKYVQISLRLTAPMPAAGLINSSEVFGADTANGDPSTGTSTGDNAWLYHIPSVADNNSNLLVLKTVTGYYDPATPTVLTPSDGSSIPRNAKVHYRITYLNSGNATQYNVVLSDTLPCQTAANSVSGITITSGPIIGTTSPVVAAGTVASNCTAAGRKIFSFTPPVASLGPGSGGDIEYNVQLSGMATATLYNVPNTATLVSNAILIGVTSNANATVAAAPSPNLLITKTTSTPTVAAGGAVTYTVTVRNTGTAATSGAITVYDFLPSTGGVANPLTNFSYLAAVSTTGITAVTPTFAVPPTLTPYSTGGVSSNQQQVLWTFNTALAAGASFSITYTAAVGNNVSSSVMPYYSSAAVLYTGGVTRSDATSVAPVTVSSSLSISSSIVSYWNTATSSWVPYGSFIPANAKVRYQLNYSNTGATDIAGANISALLPCQTAANSVSNITVSGAITVPAPNPPTIAAGNCTTGVRSAFSFTAGTILAGVSGSVTYDVQTNAANGDTVVNTATLSGTGAASATSEIQTTVQAVAALGISKAQSVSAAKVGNTVTYTLTVTNTGTANSSNISIHDWLPSGGAALNPLTRYTYVSSTNTFVPATVPTVVVPPTKVPFNTNVNAANMQELVWNFGAQTLAPGASFTISYNATIGASVPAGNYGNYARAYDINNTITGTVAATLNSTTITGTSTLFTTQLMAGNVISIGGSYYTVSAIASATSLTLTTPYLGTTGTGLVVTEPKQTNSNAVSMQVVTAIADLALTMINNAAPPVKNGDTLTYTIVLTNNGPDAADGTRIYDAAVAGLSKNLLGVSCVATGGAVCPSAAYLLASGRSDLEGTGLTISTLPSGESITLTVSTTVTATGGSVTNNASAVLPSSITEGNWSTPSTASNTTPIYAPNLSTSSKTWVDMNGGDHMQGDVIRYTISLHESGNLDATGVSVTDALPANTTGPINIISIPAGANSTSSTATNLDVRNITVAAGTTELVVFEVTIAAGAAKGSTINNCAAVSNPNGSDAAPCASAIVVAATAIPVSGIKNLYLYGSTAANANVACTTASICNASRTVTPNTSPSNTAVTIAKGSTFATWTLSPVLQSTVTISPTVATTVPVVLNLSTNSARSFGVQVDLYCSSATPATIATQTLTVPLTTTVTAFQFSLPLAADMPCAAGSSWVLKVTNTKTGTGTRNVIVTPVSGMLAASYVALPSQNVINVDSVTAYSTVYPGLTIPASFSAGSTAYLRAVVSDPFGSFDISSATVTVTGPDNTALVTNAAMTMSADSGALTKTYEYAYAITAGLSGGAYTVSVNAKEGTENTVSDTGLGTFLIPSLDHIELSHSGTGITCTPTVVTVKACANPACSQLSSSSTSVTLTPATGWGSNPITFTGSTTVNLAITTPQTVTLGASLITPTPSNTPQLVCTPSCAVVFSDAGFIFSDTPTGGPITFSPKIAGFSDGTYYLRAVKTDQTTKACESVLTGPQTVKFAYECNDPTTCNGVKRISVNGGTSTPITGNNNNAPLSYTDVSMNFNPATNDAAAFTFVYSDVGYITLRVKATANSATVLGQSNQILVYPNDFGVNVCPDDTTTDPCGAFPPDAAWLTGGGTSAFKAGVAFKATVTARICSQSGTSCLPGAAAPSFGSGAGNTTEPVLLTRTLIAPATGAPGSLTGTGATIALYRSSFNNGIVTLNDLNWSEVGVITLGAKNDIFHTNTLTAPVIGASVNVGRFRPDHFDTTASGPMNCPTGLCTTPISTMAYSGQPFSSVTVAAKNANGGTTANYQGAGFAKEVTLIAVGPSGGAVIAPTAPGGTLSATAVAATAFAGGLNSVTPANPVFTFATALTAPTDVYARAVETAPAGDGVSSLRLTNPTTTSVEGGVKVVQGRIRLSNAFGTRTSPLAIPIQAQFWSGNSWVISATDASSLTAAAVAPSPTTIINELTWSGGQGFINLAPPAAPGSIDVSLNLGVTGSALASCVVANGGTAANLPWLRSRNGNCSSNYDRDPSARATFGIYSPETKKTVHVRELY